MISRQRVLLGTEKDFGEYAKLLLSFRAIPFSYITICSFFIGETLLPR